MRVCTFACCTAAKRSHLTPVTCLHRQPVGRGCFFLHIRVTMNDFTVYDTENVRKFWTKTGNIDWGWEPNSIKTNPEKRSVSLLTCFLVLCCYITVQSYKITISNLGFRFNHYTLFVSFCIVYFVMFTSLLIFFFHFVFLSTPTVILHHTVKTPQP